MAEAGKDTPQGPVDPQGEGGIDAPAPPGGPQRTDAPSGSGPGSADGSAAESTEAERHPGAKASDNDDEPRTPNEERDLQQENAETSLDQPSS